MLFLLFQVGLDRYALEASRVVEVVPLLELEHLSQAPAGVVGIFNYRGQPVPAVDLSALTLGRPASEHLSTRIIIVNHPDARGQDHLLGIIAEQATSIVRKENRDFSDPAAPLGVPPYLGPVILDDQGIIQRMDERHLLADNVRDMLFSDTVRLNHEA